jgi:hypothetical protein
MTTKRTEFCLFGSVSLGAFAAALPLMAESFCAVAMGRVKRNDKTTEVMMRFMMTFPVFD